jgi:ADP-ribose pyrophosphatase YjhB (NUDIX family)
MEDKITKVNVDIIAIRGDKILFGLLKNGWHKQDKQFYGLPGSDIKFGEKISETVARNIKEEIGCSVTKQKIICVNENFAMDNHYIGIGILAEIKGEPKNLEPGWWERWEWFNKSSIPENLFPPAKNLIECYLKNKINISE